MTYCMNCECTEPRTREMTMEEAKLLGIENLYNRYDGIMICAECGSLEDTLIGINEDAGLDR
jgi:hypothetical protein